jgi:hypothetical protein
LDVKEFARGATFGGPSNNVKQSVVAVSAIVRIVADVDPAIIR